MKHARTNQRPTAAGWLVAVAVALGASAATLHAQEVERYVFADDGVAVYNLAGVMRVEAGAGANVVVELVRNGADARELRIETGRIDGRRTLRVLYPADRIVYPALGRGSRTTLHVRDNGTFGDGGYGWFDGGDRITIAGSGTGLEAFADIRVQVPVGKRIAVYLGAGEAFVSNVNGEIYVDTGSGSIEAAGTRGSLLLDTGSGSVSVRDAEGDVDLDTGSGSVSVRDIEGDVSVDTGSGSVDVYGISGSRLLVDTGSGGIDGGDIAVTDLEVDTGSGSIELDRVRATDILLDTGSGSVRLGLLANVSRLEIDSGSGGVTLTVPLTLSARLDLDTGSGGIDVDLPLQVIDREDDHLIAQAGVGAGSIHIDTGSGGIRVRGS